MAPRRVPAADDGAVDRDRRVRWDEVVDAPAMTEPTTAWCVEVRDFLTLLRCEN